MSAAFDSTERHRLIQIENPEATVQEIEISIDLQLIANIQQADNPIGVLHSLIDRYHPHL